MCNENNVMQNFYHPLRMTTLIQVALHHNATLDLVIDIFDDSLQGFRKWLTSAPAFQLMHSLR